MHIDNDIRAEHRVAVELSVRIVSTVAGTDLDRPTPCADWNLGDLLTHMTVQHHGFAAAARGRGAERSMWDPATVREAVHRDPAGAYTRAAVDVLDAFAADGVLESACLLPEFGADAVFPGAQAIGFHFIDYVVHGWDVAQALGRSFDIPAEVVRAAVPIACAVPDGDFRIADGSPFGPAVPAATADGDLDRVLRHLGRTPDWRLSRRG